MNTVPSPAPQPSLRLAPPRRKVPPLENGATMKSNEFMLRYEAMPEIKKAELIEGIVYLMTSPVRFTLHGKQDGILHGVMGMYALKTPGVDLVPNSTVKLDDENTFQPDALLRFLPEKGGKTKIDEEGYVAGPPELIVEIAASSMSIDLHRKLNVYVKHHVPNYIVWCTEDEKFLWLFLENGAYRELLPDENGILRSPNLPGFWLDPKALLADDRSRITTVMELGIQSPEHAAFAK